jgi:hypothetical protein
MTCIEARGRGVFLVEHQPRVLGDVGRYMSVGEAAAWHGPLAIAVH